MSNKPKASVISAKRAEHLPKIEAQEGQEVLICKFRGQNISILFIMALLQPHSVTPHYMYVTPDGKEATIAFDISVTSTELVEKFESFFRK